MLGYTIRRLLMAVPVMGIVALIVFSLLYLTPGDPAMVLTQAFVPGMVSRGYGRIVNVSSGAGQLSSMNTYAPAYSMSKAALNAFTRQLAAATKGTGVLVNSADPGWVRTDMGGRDAPRSVEQGADTIVWHLEHHHKIKLSRATVYRIVRRANLVTAEPKKKPKSSYIRFQAEQPNETWQADFTHHRLANGTDIEILTWLDDHSRYALSVTAHRPGSRRRRAGRMITTRFAVSPTAATPRATPSRTNSYGCGCNRRTRAPTTPPPAAKSNASNKP